MCKPHADTHGEAVFSRTGAGVERFGCDDASEGGDGAVRASDAWADSPLSAIGKYECSVLIWIILMADLSAILGNNTAALANLALAVLQGASIFALHAWRVRTIKKFLADLEGVG